MKLTRTQFDVLVHLLDAGSDCLPEALQTCMEELKCMGLLDGQGAVTDAGKESLEPYRTKRVLFLAAGFGSRLRPATLNVPKPMVRVHGKPIICSAIEAALAAGIQEIYIVRGYLGECFEILRNKYPQVRLVDNPEFETSNNISSAMQVRHLMQNAYVMEADLLINNPAILLADEPTGNLDEANSWEIMKLLESANERGTTVVVVTHNMDIVRAMRRRTITIDNGEVVSDVEEGGMIYEI